jgi:hypothetical protein
MTLDAGVQPVRFRTLTSAIVVRGLQHFGLLRRVNALALTPFPPMAAFLASEEEALLTTGMLNRRIYLPSDFSRSVGVDVEGPWCCASVPTQVRYCSGGPIRRICKESLA